MELVLYFCVQDRHYLIFVVFRFQLLIPEYINFVNQIYNINLIKKNMYESGICQNLKPLKGEGRVIITATI